MACVYFDEKERYTMAGSQAKGAPPDCASKSRRQVRKQKAKKKVNRTLWVRVFHGNARCLWTHAVRPSVRFGSSMASF